MALQTPATNYPIITDVGDLKLTMYYIAAVSADTFVHTRTENVLAYWAAATSNCTLGCVLINTGFSVSCSSASPMFVWVMERAG